MAEKEVADSANVRSFQVAATYFLLKRCTSHANSSKTTGASVAGVKVKEDCSIGIPASALDVKEWECEVISNRNVATFIKEFIVALPEGAHMDFIPGSYAQIKIPTFDMDYDKDIDKDSIGAEYLPAWEKFGLFGLKCRNTETTVRAYSMANYPEEGDRIMLTVRIATPPFKPKPRVGFRGCDAGYRFELHLHPKARRQGAHERPLR